MCNKETLQRIKQNLCEYNHKIINLIIITKNFVFLPSQYINCKNITLNFFCL